MRIVIIGASDLGTACALKLMRAGLDVIILENNLPLDIYHSRSFSSAVFSGIKSIENITARTFAHVMDEGAMNPHSNLPEFIDYTILNRNIPVILETDKSYLRQLSIDFTIACDDDLFEQVRNYLPEGSMTLGFNKENNPGDFSYTICDEGAYLGRVLYPFIERTDAISKASFINKQNFERIKAPIEGVFQSSKLVDELIHEKEEIGKINEIPILSPELGRISGILNSGIIVPAGRVFVEIDTSHSGQSGNLLSRNSLCLAGAVLEALLYDHSLKRQDR